MKILVDLEEDWDMIIYFNGSTCKKSGGTSVIFIAPQGFLYLTPSNLTFHASIITLSMKP